MGNDVTIKPPRVRKMGTFFCGSSALGLIVFTLYTLSGSNPMVSAEVYQSQVLPLTILPGLVVFGAAFAFWAEKTWSRHLALGFLILTGAALLIPAFSGRVGFLQSSLIIIVTIILGAVFRSLYLEETASSYYQELGGRNLSTVADSRLIYLFLVVPYINLLVVIKGVAEMLEDLSLRVHNSGGEQVRKKIIFSTLYGLFVGVIIVYIVGLSFSYLALPLTILPDMSLGEKLWQLFIWPFYNFFFIPDAG